MFEPALRNMDDARDAEAQRLARLYEQEQGALGALKKSLLQRAFSREL